MVSLRPSRNGKGWEYSITFRWPDGTSFRERRDAPVPSSEADAQRYAEARQSALLAAGKDAYFASTLARYHAGDNARVPGEARVREGGADAVREPIADSAFTIVCPACRGVIQVAVGAASAT